MLLPQFDIVVRALTRGKPSQAYASEKRGSAANKVATAWGFRGNSGAAADISAYGIGRLPLVWITS